MRWLSAGRSIHWGGLLGTVPSPRKSSLSHDSCCWLWTGTVAGAVGWNSRMWPLHVTAGASSQHSVWVLSTSISGDGKWKLSVSKDLGPELVSSAVFHWSSSHRMKVRRRELQLSMGPYYVWLLGDAQNIC